MPNYHVYNHRNANVFVFYTLGSTMSVGDFVRRINRSQIARDNHIHADTRNVGRQNVVPHANTGGHLVHITVADESLSDKLKNDPEFIDKLTDKLYESGTVDQVLDMLVNTVAEGGMMLTKEELKDRIMADSDNEAVAGAIIVYENYLVIS